MPHPPKKRIFDIPSKQREVTRHAPPPNTTKEGTQDKIKTSKEIRRTREGESERERERERETERERRGFPPPPPPLPKKREGER